MKGAWWKFSGVVIFLYVLIGGMSIPTRSGVTAVNLGNAKPGEAITLKITGYNTHFAEATNIRAWLKLDSIYAIKAITATANSQNELLLGFNIPQTFPKANQVHTLNLIIDNDIDGAFVQPSAVFINVKNDTIPFNSSEWLQSEMVDFHQSKGILFPYRNILNETIRNTFFHVALWFAMFLLLIGGVYNAIQYLRTSQFEYDIKSAAYTKMGILYGILGLLTGSVWAKYTWNTFWTNDVKLNMTAVALLIYMAYLVLRGMTTDQDKRAKLAASYSIFAFIALIPLVFVIPRMAASLHPGNGGNPALGGEDLDHTLRMFFYPSIIALTLLGLWIAELNIRFEKIKDKYFLKK